MSPDLADLHRDYSRLAAELGPLVTYTSLSKPLDGADVVLVQRLLNQLDATPMTLLLSSPGGQFAAASAMTRMIRAYQGGYHCLVTTRACSAATFVCLGADSLAMGRGGRVSPIDPNKSSFKQGATTSISAADIRAFEAMLQDWFSLDLSDGNSAELVSVLTNRIFPTELVALHRVETHVKAELQGLMKLAAPGQAGVVLDGLLSGFPEHGYHVDRSQLADLGLRVDELDPSTDERLTDFEYRCMDFLAATGAISVDEPVGDMASPFPTGTSALSFFPHGLAVFEAPDVPGQPPLAPQWVFRSA